MVVIAIIVSLALFFGGLLAMGYAFTFTEWEAAVFFLGILMVVASFALPAHVLRMFD